MSQGSLNSEIVTNFPDNTTGLIMPSNLRNVLTDMVSAIFALNPITEASTGRTLSANDSNGIMTCTNSSGLTITIPVGIGPNFVCTFVQSTLSQVTFLTSATTMNSYGGAFHTAGQYAVASLIATSSNTFSLAGNIV